MVTPSTVTETNDMDLFTDCLTIHLQYEVLTINTNWNRNIMSTGASLQEKISDARTLMIFIYYCITSYPNKCLRITQGR